MPLYEYRCSECGERFELLQKFSDPPPDACARCGKGPVERQLSSPAIQFKGTGWYITDYSQKSKPAADSGKSSDGKPADGSSSDSGTKGDDVSAPAGKGTSDTKAASATSKAAASDAKPADTASKS